MAEAELSTEVQRLKELYEQPGEGSPGGADDVSGAGGEDGCSS